MPDSIPDNTVKAVKADRHTKSCILKKLVDALKIGRVQIYYDSV